MVSVTRVLPVLAAASLLGGCSRTGLDLGVSESYTEPDGAVIDGDDTGLFFGTWICADTATTTIPGQPTEYTTDVLTFFASSDGTLTMTGRTVAINGGSVDGGVSPCATFTFYVWASTATAARGPQCSLDDGNTITTVSGAFVVSGNTATLNLVRNVTGNPPGTNTVNGTCTRYVPDAGDTD
jgi:hypothetical protein